MFSFFMIISVRVDEKTKQALAMLVIKTGKSKKKLLQESLELLVEKEQAEDVFSLTGGCWKRKETTEETITSVKNSFNKAFSRKK